MNVQEKFGEIAASFRGVNWQNPGSWPLVVKVTVYFGAAAVVMFAAYVVFITALNQQLEAEQKKQTALLKEYEEKAFKAMNLDSYKKQLADMEEAFGALLRQLPKDTEVPSLLEDITHTGLGSGLVFSQIELGTEAKKEFYAELPIQIKVAGDYHGFGSFVSGVASLPRIVTLHDFAVSAVAAKSAGKKGGKEEERARVLEMTITAKTYRYNDSSEGEAAPADAKKKGAKKSSPKAKEEKEK